MPAHRVSADRSAQRSPFHHHAGARHRAIVDRPIRSLGVVGIVLALLAALLGSSAAQAGPADQSRAAAQFASGSLLSGIPLTSVVGLGGAQAVNLGSATPVTSEAGLDVTALSLVGIQVPGGIGLLPFNQLVQLGAVNQYAQASDTGISRSASGAVGTGGAVSVGGGGTFPADATLTLQPLLSAVPVASAALSDVRLTARAVTGVAALTANSGTPAVDCADLSAPVHCRDYNIAGAELILRAPAVGTLTNTLVGPGGVAATVDAAVNTLTGPNGLLAGVLATVSGITGLVGNSGVSVTLSTNITGALNTFLDTPLTAPGSAVSINLRTGDITVNLDTLLTAVNGKGLANLAPNTEILSPLVLATLVTQVTSLLNQVPTLVNTLLTSTLNAATLNISANICLVGSAPTCTTPVVDIGTGINVAVNGTLAQIVAGPASGATASITAKVAGIPVTISAATLLGALAAPIVNVLFNPTTGVVATVTGSTSALTGAVTGAINLLGPALGVLNNVVSLRGNVQESPSAGVYREVALRASLLNNAAATLDLGKAEVGANVAVAAPTATALTPTNGPAGGGTSVTVTGTGFIAGQTSVTIGGVTIPAGSVTVNSSTSLTFTTPGGVPGPAAVTVTTPAGPSGPQTFTYNALSAPVLVTPANGATVTSPLTFSGTSATSGTATVAIAGSPVCTSPVSGGTFSCQAALPPGTYTASATVTDAVGNVSPVSNSNTFTVVLPTPAPTAASLTPTSGPVAGGTPVTVTGTNFAPGATTVTIGGVVIPAGSVAVSSPTSLTFTTPAGPAGPAPVTVTTAGGTTGPLDYTYVAAPTAASLAPAFGPTSGGQTVTINGSGFVVGATTVTVDGLTASGVFVNSPTQLTFLTPPHAAGVVPVVATTAGGTTGPLDYTYLAAPAISSLNPTSGPTAGGQIVTVTGSGFVPGLTWVTVDGVQQPLGAVTVTDSTTLTYPTPPHAAGSVLVTVTTLGGTSAPLTYTYVAAPTVGSLSPANGPLTGGTTVTVTGTGFAQAFTTVTVDGGTVPATVVSPTSLTFVTPVGDTADPVDVIVSNAGQPADTTLSFTYDDPAIVAGNVIAGASSALSGSGWRPDDTVTVVLLDPTGTPVAGVTTTVTTTAAGTFPAGTVLPIPAGTPPGNHTARATDTQGNVADDALAVLLAPPVSPLITDIAPPSGPLTGTNAVVINGANLDSTLFVYFGATTIAPTSTTPTSVTFNVPARAVPGPVTVSVQGSLAASNQLTFTYLPPVAAATSPVAAGSSTQVSTSGWNALQSLSLQLNAPDGTDVGLPVATSTDVNGAVPGTVAVPVPAGSAAGTYSVEVSNGATTVTATLQVLAAPTLGDLDPDAGSTAGGQLVTVSGTGFTPGTVVTVDGASVPAGDVVVVSPTELTYLTPGHPAGAVDVTVTTAGGTSAPLTYTYLDAPTAGALDPAFGPTAGGQLVTVTGSGFVPGSIVTVDGTPVPAGDVTVVDATELTYVTPGHPAGAVPVTVTTPGGTSGALTYTYLDAPTTASLDPTSGPTAGGQTVTVTGTGFVPDETDVVVDGVPVPATVLSPTELTYVTPAHPAGPASVAVTTPGGISTPPLAYTYLPVPTTTSLVPDLGPVSGGQTVTVTGSGFVIGATSVVVDGGTPVPATVSGPTELTYVTPAVPSAGLVAVTVVTAGGTSNPQEYTYVDAPVALSLDPTFGPVAGGNTVTVTGTDFVAGTGVLVDGAPVAATVVSPTTLTYVAPAHPAGPAPVAVVSVGGTSAPLTYTYLDAPDAVALDPANGPLTGGTVVTVTGDGFFPGATTVTVDGFSAPVTFVSTTEITFVTPVGTLAEEAVDVVVANVGQEDDPLDFVYDAPTVVAEDTLPGAPAGLEGAGWRPSETVSVELYDLDLNPVAGTQGTVTTAADGTFVPGSSVPVPASTPEGGYTVVATDSQGNVATDLLVVGQTVPGSPFLLAITPDSGPLAGGNLAIITGIDIDPEAEVFFDGEPAVVLTSAGLFLFVVVPPGTVPGEVTVEVTNAPELGDELLYTYEEPVAEATSPTVAGTSTEVTTSGWNADTDLTLQLLAPDGTEIGSPVDALTDDEGAVPAAVEVPVPADAPTGSYAVAVSDGLTTVEADFVVIAVLTASELDPNAGPVAGGQQVTVTGTGFTSLEPVLVTVDTTQVPATVLNDTTLTYLTPAHAAGPVGVTVTTDLGGTTEPLEYTYLVAPQVTSLSPTSGPTDGGQLVTVIGSGFVAPFTSVIVDGTPVPAADVTVVSGTQLTYLSPEHPAGPVKVSVTNPGGTSGQLDYTYYQTPTAVSLTPPNGPLTGGTPVTLTGTNFQDGTTTVTVAGSPVAITVVSATQLTFVSPVGTVTGPAEVVVANGSEVAAPLTFSYDVPVITAGDTIVGTPSILAGSGWRPSDSLIVVLAELDGTVLPTTPTLLTTTGAGTFPAGATLAVPADLEPGDYLAVAIDTQGNTSSDRFTAAPVPPGVPTVTDIDPDSGPLAGVDGVVITGTGFVPGAVVLVDGVEVVPTTITPTGITVDFPEGVEPGQVEVVVSNGPELDSAPLPFVYLSPTASATSPVVAGASTLVTTSGWQADTALTLQLVSPTGDPVGAAVPATTDSTGAVPGTVAVVVPVTAPSGLYTVEVSNGVTTIEADTDVAVIVAPTVSDLDPDSGPVAGGQLVTVTGAGFTGPGYETGDVEVVVDGTTVPAVDVTVLSDTSLTYLTPAHAAGVVDVVVATPAGESAPLDYTYIGVPSAESLDPTSGPLTGGTTVTITGDGFVDGVTTVWVDGVEVPATVVSGTSLTIVTPPGTLAGTVEVVVANGELLSDPLAFTYDAPTLQATDGVPGGTSEITGGGWRPVDEITLQLVDGDEPVGPAVVVVTDEAGNIPAGTLLPIPVGTEPGAYTVVAVDTEGNEAVTGIAVTPYDGPVLTDLTPGNGPLLGGTEVTATGTGFLPGAVVVFDGVEIVPVSVSQDGTTLVFVVPPGTVAGPVDVQIVSGGQPSNPLPYVYDAPTVDVGGPNVPGGEIPVTGECWPVGSTVTVQLRDAAGNPVGAPVQVVVGPDCTFTVKLPVPTDATPGEYTVDVTDDLGNSATSRLTIVQPALQIIAPVLVAGVDVARNTVIGTDWEPGVPVALEVRSDPIPLGSQIPGPDGRFVLQFSTAALPVGLHAVWATQVRTDGVIVTRAVSFEIVAGPNNGGGDGGTPGGGGSGGGGLPNTGVPVAPMLTWAALLLLLGAGLVLTPRLRERFSVR